ncbi:Os05g0547800 [Oryza sativa Japonica Group]|uniref:Os05g0547800 protein n=2 Tax=Oryza sativa subsp. japonica TaxID=39947 RepID=A0A0P0WQM5_ORYSJ|nr:unknown protein [Oryza sativa Japonica Group]KAF2931947.1 hypothetical protein DAI22_05g249800 [Oryza sativa Japonica Group]BAG93373.1 unnamed protein product [Oryza sativa Japonica Group]BAH93240.1 Os05g0547800 [Oryza sativa Japonica Group]BAS95181.1 Os05g0547800 [Oryza sativa Japonica Group]|eukprot:NP_001174512.1 Os05g0547800 [Oryza sativa Japonica Group]
MEAILPQQGSGWCCQRRNGGEIRPLRKSWPGERRGTARSWGYRATPPDRREFGRRRRWNHLVDAEAAKMTLMMSLLLQYMFVVSVMDEHHHFAWHCVLPLQS